MSINKIRVFFIAAFSLLILIVLGITGGLNLASFQQNYTNSLISSYSVLGGESVRKIEYAVQYGKPINNFYGIEQILGESMQYSPDIGEVQLATPEGELIYNQNGGLSGRTLTDTLREKVQFPAYSNTHQYISVPEQGLYHVFLPVRDQNQQWIGSLGITFDQSVIQEKTNRYMWSLIFYLLLFALASFLLLILFVYRFSLFREDGSFRKKRLLVVIFLLLGTVQLAYGTLNYVMLQNGYLKTVKDNTSLAIQMIRQDIESVVKKGVPYSQLYGVGDYMRRIIESDPEIDRISLIDSDYTSERLDRSGHISKYTYSLPLIQDSMGKQDYKVVVDMSQDRIKAQMQEILFDILTMVVISFLLMVEITLFMFIFLRRRIVRDTGREEADSELSERSIVRTLGFFVFSSMYMSSAFIPVLVKHIYRPIFGLSEEVVIGLPISAELLFVAIASLLAGNWVDKRGWKPVFILGSVVLACGTLVSSLAAEPVLFMIARSIAGFGFGSALMAMQAYVVTAPTEEAKNAAIASLNSGAYAGMNCGIVVGAMLSDRIGFSQVFLVATALVLLGGLIAIKMKQANEAAPGRPETPVLAQDAAPRQSFLKVAGHFFGNLNILGFFLFIVVPVSVSGMFLYYFFPLFAEENGISPSNIGRIFLLNGLCIVYLGPILSHMTEKYLGTMKSLVLAGLLVFSALMLFSGLGTIFSAAAAVVLLGVAEGFGLTAQVNYFISRKASARLGEGKSMGYYSLVENFGQMIGPFIFASLLAFGSAKGVGMIGLALLAALFLFVVLHWRTNKAEQVQRTESL